MFRGFEWPAETPFRILSISETNEPVNGGEQKHVRPVLTNKKKLRDIVVRCECSLVSHCVALNKKRERNPSAV
jgi:hypothetical protein